MRSRVLLVVASATLLALLTGCIATPTPPIASFTIFVAGYPPDIRLDASTSVSVGGHIEEYRWEIVSCDSSWPDLMFCCTWPVAKWSPFYDECSDAYMIPTGTCMTYRVRVTVYDNQGCYDRTDWKTVKVYKGVDAEESFCSGCCDS